MRRHAHPLVWLAAAALLATPLLACSTPGRDAAAPRVSPVLQAPDDVPVAALAMESGRKTSELAPGFPFQVPVLGGEVLTAEVVTPDSVWAYEIASAEDPVVVAEWYRRAYANANWVLDRDVPGAGESDRVLYLSKGAGAESVIEIAGDGTGGTHVVATVGLGAGIRQTY